MSLIEATVTGDDKVAARLQAAPSRLRAAIIASMQRQLFRIQAAVVTGKLSGDPLHRVTGALASSVNTKLTEGADEIVGRVGTRIRYGAVHENGGTFQIPAHTRHVTMVFGRSVAPHDIEVAAHSATFPARSFLRSTLTQLRGSVIDALRADAARAAGDGP